MIAKRSRYHEPTADARTVLRACLATPEQPRHDAWTELSSGGWRALREPLIRRAGLMPQLIHASELAGIELDQTTRSTFRAARVHEELRVQRLTEACRDTLQEQRHDAIVLRGVALSHTVYRHPELRHCHDLDLLVPGPASSDTHPTGLPIVRHDSLFARGVASVSWTDVEGDSTCTRIAGVRARTLASAEQLVHVCAHAATQGVPHNPLWCLDAALVVRSTPAVSWDRVVERALGWRVAPLVHEPLRWLRDQLGVPVPPEPLRALARQRFGRRRVLPRLRPPRRPGG